MKGFVVLHPETVGPLADPVVLHACAIATSGSVL
jgi:hypothetical protein